MQNKSPLRTIRPKISTIPREKTEASEQLELYKMVTKRQRILQEMQFMEQRLNLLKEQLGTLDKQIEDTEETIKKLRKSPPTFTQGPPQVKVQRVRKQKTSSAQNVPADNKESKSSSFQTFILEF
ncbi:gas vesicle protein [Planktothrix sp. FACHB-1355]|uniref:Gas vesicle protein n=1 Tax=Aerosakkonema funiforme FACHB-1375 TaxID=2949571 RepID=A0A926ZH86_9CYAN|nr:MULTISPECIES: gas vesicle protein [Oscillatoriales]MBD2181912.1 gas vesicle protein [Aerosakkonema funiforme FACHB-1375]MBD3561819.1 gas vesicle protein [Planktothrix sp. FACHB-1355]